MGEKTKVLLLEDNPGDVYLIGEMLEEFSDFPYELCIVGTLNDGLSLLKERPFDIVLSDLNLPDSDGIDTFFQIHARNPRIPIIIFTTMNDEKIGIDAVKKGAQDYLVKGQVDGGLLRRSIQYSIERKKAEKALTKIEIARQKEIHHRIKNNLQVVSSLLDLQADKFKCKKMVEASEVLKAFKESQDRVLSMALLHEKLHNDGDLRKINFPDYIGELADNLFLTYRLSNNDIRLDTDMDENINLDINTAVPLGLIINELISNSLKYAFVNRNDGEIRIKLYIDKTRGCKIENYNTSTYVLSVLDNGVGIPEDLDIENPDSLGLQLVTSLVEQIDGELDMKRKNGTEFIIRFTIAESNRTSISSSMQLVNNV